MSLIPWGAALRAASRLGVSPDEFWRLSLREWRMLTEDAQDQALPREAFEKLRALHPDDASVLTNHEEELR